MDVTEAVGIGVLALPTAGGVVGLVRDRVAALRLDAIVERRAQEAEAVAREAALDDERFDPKCVRDAVAEIFSAVDRVHAGDLDALEKRRDAKMIQAWARLAIAARYAPSADVRVDLVRVRNRGDGSRPSIDVRIRATRPVSLLSVFARRTVDRRWSLKLTESQWTLNGYGPFPASGPMLDSPQVASPAADDQRLSDSGLLELASEDAVVKDVADLVDPSLDPERQLADLALVDARFSADVIEAALRGTIDAWEEPARTGQHQARLSERATTAGARSLLRPPTNYDGTLVMIREATLDGWRAAAIRQDPNQPAIEVDLTVLARRFLADPTGAKSRLPGSKIRRRPISMRWTLALDPDSPHVWRLIHSTNPAQDIPGATP